MSINYIPPRMRGIKQAITEVKAADPDTALTERALRGMVHTGEIPYTKVGRKYLINMDALYTYLAEGSAAAAEATMIKPGIRPVKE